MNESASCVETTKAPEWLHKLEERREKLKGRLGHESGAGASCNECGDKCPGLDLHFWRKVCRNCKCRKDQHLCQDDDLSGWAQFEILGQIRSKPAFIKINALAEPIKLDWIPPNAAADVINDYMEKLGEKQIPISGSDAAAKRKQQLEFQVPPHDLDAKLCDNLTESESQQLEQYVRKIRDNCVGQGNVIRINSINREATISYMNPETQSQIAQKLNAIPSQIVNDKILSTLLNSEKLSTALLYPAKYSKLLNLVAFTKPLQSEQPINIEQAHPLSNQTKQKLKSLQINFPMINSLIQNGTIYDNILNEILSKNLDISEDPVLQTIQNFRQEYLTNNYFRNDLEEFFNGPANKKYATPLKQKVSPDIFNSPVAVRNLIQPKTSLLMQQETPIRKIKFENKTPLESLLNFSISARIEKDKIIEKILNSEPLKHALQNPTTARNLVIHQTPISSDMDFILPLSKAAQVKLDRIGLNNKNCIQSGYVNGAFYDKLFNNLKSNGIVFGNCKLLEPIAEYRAELVNDPQFHKEIGRLVQKLPNDVNIFESLPLNPSITNSNSSDSGFIDPPTPNYATFPGGLHSDNAVEANPGKFSSIPLIEDLNMYPNLNLPSDHSREMQEINKNLTELQLNANFEKHPVPVLNCKDCNNIIFSGDVAVKAERAGQNISWHPECFKCHKCRELLADLVYFFHEDNVYCGRDLALILKIPRCKACDELIFTKEYTAAENATFHIKHFCCFHCDLPLAGKKYVPDEKTNMPICLDCYDEYYAAKCQLCLRRIGPEEQGVSWNNIHWHADCFKCAGLVCGGKSLIGGRFRVKDNLPFCSPECLNSIIK